MNLKKIFALYKATAIEHSGSAPFDHLIWMCDMADAFASDGQIEKANRWLGFIQGVFWAHNVFTIEEMKEHNRSL